MHEILAHVHDKRSSHLILGVDVLKDGISPKHKQVA